MSCGIRQRRWLGVLLCVSAVMVVVVWAATLDRDTWDSSASANRWPRFIGIHHGRLVVMSTWWRADDTGQFAWSSKDWIYDTLGGPRSLWRVSYARVGDSYSGTPPYKADIDALFVPLWYLALPLGWLGIVRAWRSRIALNSGRCERCGYLRNGLADAAGCPECGRAEQPSA